MIGWKLALIISTREAIDMQNRTIYHDTRPKQIVIKKNKKTNGIDGSPWSTFLLVAPYITLFVVFIALPVFISALLSLAYFNAIQFPTFVGFIVLEILEVFSQT